ncbi:PHD finger protein ING1-like, partial [Myzus persicae]|uniref:PHD finger protein ING1-like n=1 Tax=Myzus persicae TaxID=13164 RepID=UPI000B9325BD
MNTSNHGQNVSYNGDVLKVITSNTNGTRKHERKCIQRISNLGSPDYNIFDGIIDASEPRYCICDQVAFGTMVACDNKRCITEWFHSGCVGIKKPPRGKWYCPKCRNTVTKLKMSKK